MTKTLTCAECGNEFTSVKRHAEFCSTQCRSDFNNRRRVRGAQLYDLMMEHRYNRERNRLGFDANGVRDAMYKLTALWRELDARERNGRESWADPREALLSDLSWKYTELKHARKRKGTKS